MKTRRAVIVIAALTAPALACQLILGIDDHSFSVRSDDAQVQMEAGTDAVVSDPCAHVSPPGRPDIPNEPGDTQYVVALYTTTITERADGGALVGFDLDRSCTCDNRPGVVSQRTCEPPPGVMPEESCDADGGIDNASATVFGKLTAFLELGGSGKDNADKLFNQQARCGRQTVLLALRNYNGKANDPDVAVVSVTSFGIREAHLDAGERTDRNECLMGLPSFDAVGYYPAKLDVSDLWSVRAGSMSGGYLQGPSAPGYVRDYQLIIDGRGDINPVNISIGPTIVSVISPVLSARLIPYDSQNKQLNIENGVIQGDAKSFGLTGGQIAGRTATSDILSAVGAFDISGNPGVPPDTKFVCESAYYDVLKDIMCNAADTLSTPKLDFMKARCDSISLGLQFEGAAASVSPKESDVSQQQPTICGRTPFRDSCGSAYEAGVSPACDGGDGGC